MRACSLALAAIVVACGGDEAKTAANLAAVPTPPACSEASLYGDPALDRLLDLTVDGGLRRGAIDDPDAPLPALYAVDIDSKLRPGLASTLTAALEAASRADLGALPVRTRIVLQNDVWGFWQRLRIGNTNTQRLSGAAARLVMALSVPRDAFTPADGSIPRAVLNVIGPRPFEQPGSELAVFGHERLYGMRRLFRVLAGPSGDAVIFSQVVAIDRSGTAHLTPIVGEIERLSAALSGALEAEVYELSRRALRCDTHSSGLVRAERIAHVPGLGANGFFARFEPSVPATAEACEQCHHGASDDPNSLHTDDDPALRRSSLIKTHPALARTHATGGVPAYAMAELLAQARHQQP